MNWLQKVSQLRTLAGILHGSRAFGGPYQASFSLSNRCNLRCIHCYFYSPLADRPNFFEVRSARSKQAELPDAALLRSQQREDADTARTAELIDELLAMGTRRFHFSGSGEPFLHPDILDLLSRVKKAGAYCMINTNGTLLHPPVIDRLMALGVDSLRVTAMAGRAKTYLATHPGCHPETFERLKQNLLYLAERKASSRATRPVVTLVYIIVGPNHDGLPDFADFARRVRADEVSMQAMDDVADPGLAALVPTEEQTARVRSDLPAITRQLESDGIAHNLAEFAMLFRRKLHATPFYQVIPCYMGWITVRFQVGGLAYACHRCYEPLGNAYEQKFAEIWRGAAYRRFRRNAHTINRRDGKVAGCDCDSCCHYMANLRVYRALHPLNGRSTRIRQTAPPGTLANDA
jgi:MoaA/NifB/PqqE/SkfB family radical SAM enzyme